MAAQPVALPPHSLPPAPRILLMQTAFIGDVILATPVLDALRQAYPDARIEMLVRKGNEGLVQGHPALQHVWIWDKRRKYASLWSLARQLRAQRFDLLINLQRFATSGLLAWAVRARHKVGFAKNPLSWAYHRAYPHTIDTTSHLHEVQRNLSVLAHLGIATPQQPPRPSLHPSKADYTTAVAAISAWPEERPYVVLAPSSVWATKAWPLELWQELITLVPQAYGIALVGAPNERTHLAPLAQDDRTLNLAGELTLIQTAALMAGAARVFANDSAPLHLASAMNAPTTALFCSTVPAFGFGPLAHDAIVLETPEALACRPCGLHGYQACPEGHFNCGWNITAQLAAATLK